MGTTGGLTRGFDHGGLVGGLTIIILHFGLLLDRLAAMTAVMCTYCQLCPSYHPACTLLIASTGTFLCLPLQANHNFIRAVAPHLVPVLLEQLTKQEDDTEDEGSWNLAMASGTCLGLIARVAGDAVVPLVMPFVQVGARVGS